MNEDTFFLATEIRGKIDRIKDSIVDFKDNHLLDNFLVSIGIGPNSIERIRSIAEEDLRVQMNLLEQQFKEL
jgi:hypothetical protein